MSGIAHLTTSVIFHFSLEARLESVIVTNVVRDAVGGKVQLRAVSGLISKIDEVVAGDENWPTGPKTPFYLYENTGSHTNEQSG